MIALLALLACHGASDVADDVQDDTDVVDTGTGPAAVGMEQAVESSGQSGSDGLYVVPVDVREGDAAFLVSASTGRYLSVERVEDPAGNVVLDWQDWDGAYSITDALWPYYPDLAVNWPIRDVDGTLTPGTWKVVLATTSSSGSYVGGAAVQATTQVKRDDDLTTGTVHVRIVWADGVDQDADVVAAVKKAVERWRTIWAPYGLTLVERYDTSTVDPRMDDPTSGDAAVQSASAGNDGEEVMLLVGEKIGATYDTYGEAGGIPGSLLPGGRSGVLLSWLACAGSDAAFSADDIELMAETMAHEVGHFQGMYHPVESSYDYWDALDDTPECTTPSGCEDKLGTNLMFPYSICSARSCVDQDQLTPQQSAEVQRYTGTL